MSRVDLLKVTRYPVVSGNTVIQWKLETMRIQGVRKDCVDYKWSRHSIVLVQFIVTVLHLRKSLGPPIRI